jgi:hypothetical protein
MSGSALGPATCLVTLTLLGITLALSSSGTAPAAPKRATTITVGPRDADVVGEDSYALQKAADRLAQTGGTLIVKSGNYTMYNSLNVPSNVTVRGDDPPPVLVKCDGYETKLVADSGYGVDWADVEDASALRIGMGISFLDDGNRSGWSVNVRTITAIKGNHLTIDALTNRDYVVTRNAFIRTAFPIVCGLEAENVRLENLIVDGNRHNNGALNGCRGGAIYFWKSRNCHVVNCVARNFNGDGISFQVSPGVTVENCESHDNAALGVHPGSGSHHCSVSDCRIHDNGSDGLFLCWRVQHSRFAHNDSRSNGRHGISIGHRDTDNIFVNNTVTRNARHGVCFRSETEANAGHRNTLRDNTITDNGASGEGCGVYISGITHDITLVDNVITDTRDGAAKTQQHAVWIAEETDGIKVEGNDLRGNKDGAIHNESAGERNSIKKNKT